MARLLLFAIVIVFFAPQFRNRADSLPLITVIEPTENTLFHDRSLRLHAIGIDEAGPVKMNLYQLPIDPITGGTGTPILIAIGTNEVDVRIDIRKYSGQVVRFKFIATDSAFQESSVITGGEVIPNSTLIEVLTVPGRLEAIGSNAVLYIRSEGQTTNGDGNHFLVRRDRQTGTEETIANLSQEALGFGYLTPAGAIYVDQGEGKLIEFEQGISMVVDDHPDNLTAIGSFAVWNSSNKLVLRDLTLKINVIVSTNSSSRAFILPAGDVIYVDDVDHQIYRYSRGAVTPVTADLLVHDVIGADSSNVLDRRSIPADNPPFTNSVVLVTASGEVVLKENSPTYPAFQLNDGFVAYEEQDANGHFQIWERLPDGTRSALTFAATNSNLIELGPEGQVLFATGSRYYSRPGSEPLLLDPTIVDVGNLNVGFVDGALSITAGASLFRLNPYSVNPRVSPPSFVDGGWQIGASGKVGQSFAVQRSDDLDVWTNVVTGVFGQSAQTVPISIETSKGFFRALYR